jgi:TM2 domain-containing membrane protein YozV
MGGAVMVMCPKCRTQLEIGRFEQNESVVACPDCNAAFTVGEARAAKSVRVLKKRRNPGNDFAAFLISLIIPGAGHLVKAKVGDGLVYFIVAVACVCLALVLDQHPIVGAFGAGLIGIVSGLSAYRA